jgi:hypothetical protein
VGINLLLGKDMPKLPLTPVLFSLILGLITSCSPRPDRYIISADYQPEAVPQAPIYSKETAWAALPTRRDAADGAPEGTVLAEAQNTAAADVFFIYPTIYTDNPDGRFPWNASVTDSKLNEKILESTIRQQASIFNAAGKVYAPFYRQAHISAYYTADTSASQSAFDIAYADVLAAFEYYLKHYNQGRPFIIASHSQGTTHAKRLLAERIDGQPIQQWFVAAYLVGIPVQPDAYKYIPVCEDSKAIGCFVSWRTWQRPATPWSAAGGTSSTPLLPQAAVVNPLNWTTNTTKVPASLNKGGTLRRFKLIDELTGAQVHDGILWIDKPDFFGSAFIRIDNWHIADYNLFYENVRLNALERVQAYIDLNSE